MNSIRLTLLIVGLNAVSALVASAADETAPPNGVVNFHSAKEIVDLIPRQAMMQLKIPTQAEAAKTAANAALSQNALDKWVSWKVKVVKWEPWDSPGVVPNKFRISVADQNMNVNGTLIGVRMLVYLGADAEPIVTKLNKGADVTVTSFLNRVDVTNNKAEGLKVNLDMTRTKIEPSAH
jgi:hypothetical protein